MMTIDKKIVQLLKTADRIVIEVVKGGQRITVTPTPNSQLHHDITIAYQTAARRQ